MKTDLLVITALALVLSFFPQNIYAEGGSSEVAASYMDISPDARSFGMGGITATSSATAFSFWNNSSSVMLGEEKWQAGVSYVNWKPEDGNVFSAGGYGRVTDFMAVTAGVKYYGKTTFNIYDEYGRISSPASPADISAGVGVAFKIVNGLALSANVSWFSSSLGVSGASTASGISADLGASYHIGKLRLGLTASNLGSKIDYGGTKKWSLPANVKFGAGGTLGSEEHSVCIDAQAGLLFSGSSFFASAGAEYTFHKMLSVRAGYHYGDLNVYVPSYISAGLGFRFKWLEIDGAYLFCSGDSPLKNTFAVNLAVAF